MTRSTQIADYERSAAEFRLAALDVPSDRWDQPRMEGKWSPAQETEHIVLSHELFLSQLNDGPAMRVIVTGWKQLALRWIALPWILRTGRFPRGARAPRESRPVSTGARREELLARLDRAAREVSAWVGRDEHAASRRRLQHPYFGMMSVMQVVRLSTVHTRHHAARLPGSPPRG